MTMDDRPLSSQEIQQLCQQGNTCSDWSHQRVAPGFETTHIHNCRFSGRNTLGRFRGEVTYGDGIPQRTGLYGVHLHDCTIADQVTIRQVGGTIARVHIHAGCLIENIGRLEVHGSCRFGNGTPVQVVNETGGRAVPLYDTLNASVAYLLTFYRYDPEFVQRLHNLIDTYVAAQTGTMGQVGTGAVLRDCSCIRNTRIGPYAQIEGVTYLENGTVLSCREDPARVGPGVIARDFILSEGATVTDSAQLKACFVGQGAIIKAFDAEHCLFFANAEAYRGEACALFAGPYSVTHHQATLLIASYLSFFNAGSGTNQSNHMYRLGPGHQGMLDRGCKTASGAYVCWPAHIGAFSFVKGTHYSNPDTRALPFSYLIERRGTTMVHPGATLGTIGLARDIAKWSQRDRRRAPYGRDRLDVGILNPYTVGALSEGHRQLTRLLAQAKGTRGPLRYQRTHITRAACERGLELYRLAIDQFLGQCLCDRLADRPWETAAQWREALTVVPAPTAEPWVDLAGAIVPQHQIASLIDEVRDQRLVDLSALHQRLAAFGDQQAAQTWSWALAVWLERLEKHVDALTVADAIDLLRAYQHALQHLTKIRREDAAKEFASLSRVGYGRDGGPSEVDSDFTAVHGSIAQHDFLRDQAESLKRHTEQADTLIERLQRLDACSFQTAPHQDGTVR